MSNSESTPNSQTVTGGQSEKQIAQWMQLQQNRIDTELQQIRQTQVKLEKVTAVIAERAKHTNDRVTETTTSVKDLESKITAINTKITVAIAVIVAVGVVLGFVLGSDLKEVATAVKALSEAKANN